MAFHRPARGGSCCRTTAFVLHTPGARYSSSLTVTDQVAFTTSIDVLEAVAAGDGPEAHAGVDRLFGLESRPAGR